MRINLTVPFADKDRAKLLGCKWDAARKTWYIMGREDITPFVQWMDRADIPKNIDNPPWLEVLRTMP